MEKNKENAAINLLNDIIDEFVFTDKGNILNQVVMGKNYQCQGFVTDDLKRKLLAAKDMVKGKKTTYTDEIKKEGKCPINMKVLKVKKPKKEKKEKVVKKSTIKTKSPKSSGLSSTKQNQIQTVKLVRKAFKKTITRKDLLELCEKNGLKNPSFITNNQKYKTKERSVYKIPALKDFK